MGPRGQVAIRVVITKACHNSRTCDRLQSWLMKHPVFCSILKQLHDEHVHSIDAFVALAEFKLPVGTARTRARQVLVGQSCKPWCQALVAAIAMKACRKKTRFCCGCQAWEPVGRCFDIPMFFHALNQIIANLTRGSIAERERTRVWSGLQLHVAFFGPSANLRQRGSTLVARMRFAFRKHVRKRGF